MKTVVLVCLALVPFNLWAATPLENLKQQDLRLSALEEIGAMTRAELDAATAYIATCAAASRYEGALAQYQCDKERQIYHLRAGRRQKLELLLVSYFVVAAETRPEALAKMAPESGVVDQLAQFEETEEFLNRAFSAQYKNPHARREGK